MSITNHFHWSIGRKIAVAAMVVTLLGASNVPVSAAATQTATGTGIATASVTIDGTINPTIISVTVPDSVAYSIDPNSNTFTAPPLSVANNTVVPVTIGVQSLTADSSGAVADVLPGDIDWSKLTAENSPNYLALGVGITDATGWSSGYNTSTDWAASKKAITFGSLAAGATGTLALSANYGRAFSAPKTPTGSIVFSVSLL